MPEVDQKEKDDMEQSNGSDWIPYGDDMVFLDPFWNRSFPGSNAEDWEDYGEEYDVDWEYGDGNGFIGSGEGRMHQWEELDEIGNGGKLESRSDEASGEESTTVSGFHFDISLPQEDSEGTERSVDNAAATASSLETAGRFRENERSRVEKKGEPAVVKGRKTTNAITGRMTRSRTPRRKPSTTMTSPTTSTATTTTTTTLPPTTNAWDDEAQRLQQCGDNFITDQQCIVCGCCWDITRIPSCYSSFGTLQIILGA